jgi:hypothetical protein
MALVDRIEQRIRDIPTSNPMYITVQRETLGNLLDRMLVRKIAEIAAEECTLSKNEK